MRNGTVWKFETANFTVQLAVHEECNYRYDGDDENGETQAAIDSGEMVAFMSTVSVTWNGETIGADHLGGSVYYKKTMSEFWTDHRSADPMNRNCTIMRGKHPAGPRVSICHYFPGMVSNAIKEARQHIRELPKVPYIRETA